MSSSRKAIYLHLESNGSRCVGSGYFEHLLPGFEKRHRAMISGRQSALLDFGRRIERLDIGYAEHFVMANTVVMAMTFSKFRRCATEFD